MYRLPPHAANVMAIFGFPHGADIPSDLWWRTYDDGTIELFANCSDTFAWGTADCELIEEGDVPLLQQCLDDLHSVKRDYEMFLGELFAARKRKMRPMDLWMKRLDEELQALFPTEKNTVNELIFGPNTTTTKTEPSEEDYRVWREVSAKIANETFSAQKEALEAEESS